MARLLLLVLLLRFASLAEASVVISEVLADPPSGAAGDANQDGQRDTYADEFIELYNAGSASVDISGWRLGDSTSPDNFFQFPSDAVIEPGSYVVLFGGGNPSGFTVPVYTDDGRIGNGLTNGGEDIRLIDNNGHEIDVISHEGWPTKQSLVRHPPDVNALVPHKTASTVKALFSPGHTHIIPKPSYPLFISEVLADPPSGLAGDANRDGRRDTYEDEFIELYNAGSEPISLAGWRLGDSTSPKNYFRFPPDAVIAPHSYIVLFGGGNPSGFTTPVYIDDGKIGNGLTKKGEDIRLIDNNGHEIDVISHDEWPAKQSLVRIPSDGGPFIPHKTASPVELPFSPGHSSTTRPILTYPLFISEVLADPPEGSEGDANLDGRYDPHEDEFIELYNAGSHPISLAGWRLGDSGSLSNYFRFPRDAVIEPGSYVVLFGGGHPSGFTTPVYTDDGRIGNGLTNKGEDIQLIDDAGNTVAIVSHGTWPKDQSIVRNPPDGGAFVAHKTVSPTEAPFSPGHAPETQPETPEVPETPKPEAPETPEPETPSEPKPTYALFISEVLADPPSSVAGDANQDGQRDGYEDEFIELYNADTNPISLAGWRLGDSTSPDTHFRFPSNAVIEPGSYVVLFGGGNPSGFTTPVYTDDGRIGNGLTNKGEDIQLTDDAGNTVAVVSYGTWPKDQSIVRNPPDGGAFVAHKTVSPTEAPFSPGHAPETQPETPETPEMVFIEKIKMPPAPTPSPPVLQSLRPVQFEFKLVRGEHRSLRLLGQYSDGSEHPIDIRATWTSSDSTIAAVRPDGTLAAIDIGTCQISVQLDSFAVHPNSINVEVRLPLADAVRFSPPWNEAVLPLTKPQAFIIRTAQPYRHAYYWSLNGRRLPVMSPQYIHIPTGRQTDTVHVAIRRGTERITRAWIIHPPAAKLPAYSFQVWPNPFNTTTQLHFYLSQVASVHLAIYNVQGQRVRTLVDAPLHAGAHQMQWDGRDERGHSLASGLYFARFRTAHGPPRYAKLILLR